MRLNETVRRDPMWARLDDQWKPIPKRPGYVIAALACSGIVILLPVLYFTLIAALGYGIYWHLTTNVPSFDRVSGRAVVGLGMVYVTPALIGLGLIIFMLKPLLAPEGPEGRPTKLEQYEELDLHSFVENVCAVIGAPAPKEIHIDCDINASAGFRNGIWSIFSRGDVVLTIGLPLVAAMTKRQFAGILAHEFGHFAQGTGMRLTYLTRVIVFWLVRVAYQRDGWDAALDTIARNPDSGAWAIGAWVLKLCVWVSRIVLIAIAWIAQLLCSFMLRQMERDADRYETQLCGADAFVGVCHGVNELADAMPRAMEESSRLFRKKDILPDNFPVYVADFRKRLTPEAKDAIRTRIEKSRTGFFSTHPSDRERIAAARQRNEPGLYLDESPASNLFGDFEAASKKATLSHWQGVVGGPGMAGAELVPTAPLLRAGAGFESRASGLARYFGFEPPSWRPVFAALRGVPETPDIKIAVQRHRAARTKQKPLAEAAATHSAAYRAASEKIIVWEQVRTAFDAGFKPDFKALDLRPTTRAGVSTAIDRLVDDSHRAADVIDEAIDAAMDRLSAALCLLGARGADKLVPGAEAKRTRANELLAAMATMREMFPLAKQVRSLNSQAVFVIACVKSESMIDRAKKALRPLSDQIRDLLDDARRIGGGTRDPLSQNTMGDHSAEANLGETLVGATPAHRDL